MKKIFYFLYAVFFNLCRIFPVKNNRIAFVAPHNGGEKDSLGVMRSYIEKVGGYDIVCANIVADIIIRMTPDVAPFMHEKTVLLASGIISERCDDVVSCFEEHGFKIVERAEDNGWCALAVMIG